MSVSTLAPNLIHNFLIFCVYLIFIAAVARSSLLVQNLLVVSCAVVFGLAFHYDISRCDGSVWLFSLVSGLVIFLGSAANLATVANTIAIERDWVVVIADKNKDTLASKLQ